MICRSTYDGCVPGVRHVKFLRDLENFESSLSLVQFLRRHRDPGIPYRRGQFPPGCPGSRQYGTGHKSRIFSPYNKTIIQIPVCASYISVLLSIIFQV